MSDPKHVIKMEYDDGKKLGSPTLWCGAHYGFGMVWHFLDAQHAALVRDQEGYLTICPNCKDAIIKALNA